MYAPGSFICAEGGAAGGAAVGAEGGALVFVGHGRSSMTVRPIRIGTPTGTGVGAVMRARSR
jgi:hypothetical protein